MIAELAINRAEAHFDQIDARAMAADVMDAASVGTTVATVAEGPRGLQIGVVCVGVVATTRPVGRDGPPPLRELEGVVAVNRWEPSARCAYRRRCG